MRTLIVWQTISEETHCYLLPEEVAVAVEHEPILTKAAGNLVNTGDEMEVTRYLNLAFMDPQYKPNDGPDYACSLHQYKVEGDLTELMDDGPVMIIFSGYECPTPL